jgi:hypothetical protein
LDFLTKKFFHKKAGGISFDAEFHSHVFVSISLFHRTINYIEKTNTYKNQIVLTMLSVSKLIDKNMCHSVTLGFCIFYLSKNSLENVFKHLKVLSKLYKTGSRREIVSQESAVLLAALTKKVLFR